MPETQEVSWEACKLRLGLLWLSVGGVVFVLLVIMSMAGKFGNNLQDAWGWFLTTMMPNLSLIVGVLLARDDGAQQRTPQKVNPLHYWMAMALSIFYLVVVIVTLLATSAPMVDDANRGIAMLRLSNFWLGPLQGFASAALGIFYVRAKPAG